jgi:hypothetical protein
VASVQTDARVLTPAQLTPVTTKNTLIHDGLFWSQTSENVSQLTHDDDREKRRVSRVIHLQDQIKASQIGISVRHGITDQQQ